MSHEPAKPRVMVTARAVLLHRGRVLLLRAEEPGREYYFLPGGMVRHGERMEDACVREVAEETGIEVRVLRPLYFREFIAARHRRRARGMPEHHHVVALVFLCEVAGPQAQQDCEALGAFQRDTGAGTVTGLCWKTMAEVEGIEIHPPQVRETLLRGIKPAEAGIQYWPEEA